MGMINNIISSRLFSLAFDEDRMMKFAEEAIMILVFETR